MIHTIIERASVLYKILRGKEIYLRTQVKRNIKWVGSSYGGFNVVSDLLKKNAIVYSFGVGEDISFDLDLIHEYSCSVFAFDPTPKSIEYIESYHLLPSGFRFSPIGVYSHDGEIEFFLPQTGDDISCTTYNRWGYDKQEVVAVKVPVKKFSTIARELQHAKIDLLKMDIEGSEYAIIDDILASGVKIDQMLIEMHHRFEGIGIKMTRELIFKMNNAGFKIAAISASRLEYTFVKE